MHTIPGHKETNFIVHITSIRHVFVCAFLVTTIFK